MVAVLSMLMVFRAFPSWSCTIIFEAPVSPTSESLVSKSAYSVLEVKSVLPVDETASVFVIEVIPKAEATVPSSVPPVTTSLPVASIEAEPPFWWIWFIRSLMVVSCETFKSLELNLKVYPSLLGGRGGWRSKINQELIYFPLKKKKQFSSSIKTENWLSNQFSVLTLN